MGIKVFRFFVGRWNLVMLVIVVALTVIIAGIYYYNKEEKLQREERYNELKAIADLKTYQIIQWREQRIKDASVAYSQFFGKSIAEYAAGRLTEDLEKNLIGRLNLYESLYQYKRAFITDIRGNLILSSGSSQTGINRVTLSTIESVRASNSILLSDVFLTDDSSAYLVEVVAPIYTGNDLIAFLVLQDDPFDALFPMIQSWPTPSRSAETVLVRKDGDFMIFINELRHEKHTALKRRIPLSDTTIAGVQAILGNKGVSEAIDYRDVIVFSDLRAIPGTNWFMVTKVDKKEMLAELRSKAVLIGGLVVGILVILAVGMILIFSYRQRNIYRELFKTENELAATDEEFRTTLYSIGDAVIICDNDSFIRNINPVAESLTGWKESEVKGKPLQGVLYFTSDSLTDSIHAENFTYVSIDELSDKSKYISLISRTEERIPISASVSEIRNGEGQIRGKIYVFRDQSAERQAEVRLRYSEEMFAKLFQLGAFPTFLIRLSDQVFIDVNESMLDTSGYSKEEIVGKTSAELGLWKSPEGMLELRDILLEKGIVEGYEIEYFNKKGKLFIGKLYSRIIEQHNEKFFLTMLLDFTEQKKSEEALKESEQRYRNTLDNMMEGCQILDKDWRYVYINQKAAALGDLNHKEMIGRKITDFFPDFESTEMFRALEICMRERVLLHREFSFIFPDGRLAWFDFSIQPIPEGIFILSLDITDTHDNKVLIESQYTMLSALINSSKEIDILSVDTQYRYTTFNEYHKLQIKNITGIEIKLGDNLLEILPATMLSQVQKTIDRALAGESFSVIEENETYDRFLDFHLNPIRRGDQIMGATVFIRDITDQILAQAEILEAMQKAEESEKHYRLLAERMIDVIWVIDAKTLKFKYVSPSVEILSGYTLEEAVKMGLDEILTAESLEGTLQEMQNGFTKFSQGDFSDPSTLREMEIIRKDGSTVWTEVAASLVMNERNEIELVGISRDITERKKADIELKANETRFRMLLELVPYPLAFVDQNRYITFRNQKFIETLGYTQEDIYDMESWWETAYPDPLYRSWVMESWVKSVEKASQERQPVKAEEYAIKCKSGEYKVFEISGIDYNEGFLATFIDITERKRIEDFDRLGHEVLKELHESSNTDAMILSIVRLIKKFSGIEAVGIRLKVGDDFPYIGIDGFPEEFVKQESNLCLHNSSIGLFEKDEDGNVMLACMCGNILQGRVDPAHSFFTDGGSFRSNNTSKLLSETTVEDRKASTRNSCTIAGYESVALIPIRAGEEIMGLIQLNDHRIGVFKEGIIQFFESLGNSIGLALMRDKAKDELEKMNTQLDIRVKDRTLQLEEANRELESFSYSVSHDLRAPLRHIGGFSEILSAEYQSELPDKARHYLKIINQSVKKMGNLIDDLLQFSRTGRTDLRKAEFNISRQVQDVITELTNTGKPYNIEWEIADLPSVTGDSNLIRLVWLNLISNAIKYSQDRDPIKIEIGYATAENEHIFTIRDNGIGFDMKYAHKLFGVFQRLHSSDQFEGTGIGLANVRRIIARHGGRTWAESTPNNGATFSFTIPIVSYEYI